MRQYELLMIAVSLSMDAFAVSVCKGLAVGRPRLSHCVTCGCWFGGFQALMPLVGWLLGVRFQGMIVSVDHWIAFVLLGMIGFNMVRESRGGGAEELDCKTFGAEIENGVVTLPGVVSRKNQMVPMLINAIKLEQE